jgi:hypothetical protein
LQFLLELVLSFHLAQAKPQQVELEQQLPQLLLLCHHKLAFHLRQHHYRVISKLLEFFEFINPN